MPRTGRSVNISRRMSRRRHGIALLVLLVGLVGTVPGAANAQDRNAQAAHGVTTLTGAIEVTNPFVLDIITEPFVLLNDLSNFVARDIDAPLPDFLQVMARLDGDLSEATYTLPLPIAPQATITDVDQGERGDGVHVYTVDLWANIVGDPFVDPIEGGGWSTSFTSVDVAIGTNEITGGRLVVWAPDDEQAFPSGFGDDGLLFTEDDPVAPVAAGWTVVDLEAEPFGLLRDAVVEVDIFEGSGGLQDLSELSFTEAFDALVADLRLRYPFTEYKGIDWDALIAQFRPRIERAEERRDLEAFQIAMMRFTVAIGDGHVAIEPNLDYLIQQFGGGLGLTLGETDDGTVLSTAVVEDGEAWTAGIERGSEILTWNGQPIGDAIAETLLMFSASSPHTTRLQQLTLLPRGEVGKTVSLTFRRPGGDEGEATLTFVGDLDGLVDALGGDELLTELPVTVDLLPSGFGYVRVNTFYDDLILMTHAWEWALERLAELDAPGLIVDVRGNSGGNGGVATYFAGSFFDEEFALAEAFFATEDGEFISSGTQTIFPSEVQWDGPVAVLIDANCASACEIFTAALAIDPDHLIVGQYPTAGVEAGVFPWLLPGEIFFQAPLEYFEADGAVWIEGVGVPPTVDVPVTVDSLLNEEDVVLQAAEDALS